MTKIKYPVTPAIRFLRSKKIDFRPFLYDYAQHGGARQAAAALNVPAHRVIKTLVMETDGRSFLLVLMHGDRAVSTRQLARAIGSRAVQPIPADTTVRCTGYRAGGISPFGTRKAMRVYVPKSVLDLPTIFINGGKRGFLLEIKPEVLLDTLGAIAVDGLQQ
jgi:Cys-tRNA(Pro) deacylase